MELVRFGDIGSAHPVVETIMSLRENEHKFDEGVLDSYHGHHPCVWKWGGLNLPKSGSSVSLPRSPSLEILGQVLSCR